VDRLYYKKLSKNTRLIQEKLNNSNSNDNDKQEMNERITPSVNIDLNIDGQHNNNN